MVLVSSLEENLERGGVAGWPLQFQLVSDKCNGAHSMALPYFHQVLRLLQLWQLPLFEMCSILRVAPFWQFCFLYFQTVLYFGFKIEVEKTVIENKKGLNPFLHGQCPLLAILNLEQMGEPYS